MSINFSPHFQMIERTFFTLLTIIIFNGCGEACEKHMTVTGTVKDSANSQVLSNVNVFCCTTAEKTTAITSTGTDGKYSFTKSNDGGFTGSTVRFEKNGYVSQDATALTKDEAGIDRCGDYTVIRDIVLTQ